MNPRQFLMNQLQNQLKATSPQSFKQFQEMQNGNPQEILNNMTSKYTPEQKQGFAKFLKSFGISDEQINQCGIDTK